MEKIFVVIVVARQVMGEMVFVRSEQAFRQASRADELVAQKRREFTGPDGKARPVKISTPHGEAECLCEVGVHELQLVE
jgi:hypothetical protein